MADLFLSYSREDQAIARRFAEGLQHAGFSVWWDQTLSAGEAFDEVTEKALHEAKAVIVLWSPRSVSSRWVRAEASQADDNGTLVPAIIEACALPMKFRLTQAPDISGWKGEEGDPRWQSFVGDVRRFIEGRNHVAGSSAAQATTVIVAPAHKAAPRHSAWLFGGVLAVLVAIGAGWLLLHYRSEVAPAPVPTAEAVVAAPQRLSIAVLPFLNLSSDPEQEYFSEGLSEELLNELSKVPDLRVVGRTSSFAYKGKDVDSRTIGEQLDVNRLLQGSVRKAGNQVKVTATLIDPMDGTQIWSEGYERTLEDIFAIQEDIAANVVRELKLRMSPQSAENVAGTRNLAAYNEYLAGRALLATLTRPNISASVSRLEKAVELDPEFVPAWLWLIDVYLRQRQFGGVIPKDGEDILRRQRQAISRVMALAPGSPEASLAESYGAALGRDLVKLEQLMKDATRLTGSLGARAMVNYAQFLGGTGQPERPIAELERIKNMDPLDLLTRLSLIQAYDGIGDSVRARAEQQQVASLFPGEQQLMDAIELTRAMGQPDGKAMRELRGKVLAEQAGETAETAGVVDNKILLQMLDNRSEAIRYLRRQFNQLSTSNPYGNSPISLWAAWFGDNDLAMESLRALQAQHWSFETWSFTLWRPVYRNMRNDPRFKQIVREVGLEDYWRRTGNWGSFCEPRGERDFQCH